MRLKNSNIYLLFVASLALGCSPDTQDSAVQTAASGDYGATTKIYNIVNPADGDHALVTYAEIVNKFYSLQWTVYDPQGYKNAMVATGTGIQFHRIIRDANGQEVRKSNVNAAHLGCLINSGIDRVRHSMIRRGFIGQDRLVYKPKDYFTFDNQYSNMPGSTFNLDLGYVIENDYHESAQHIGIAEYKKKDAFGVGKHDSMVAYLASKSRVAGSGFIEPSLIGYILKPGVSGCQ